MKSILKKVAGLALVAGLVFGMFGCANGTTDSIIETVETPAFSVASGAVNSGTSVTISCATEGAKIYYTIDGSEPTASSKEYTAAITVTTAVTIKAIAVKSGMTDSTVASASYTIKGTVVTPAFSVASGAVTSGTSVTISCTTEGAKIYYTTDGSEPTASSKEYTAAITVTTAVTIKAIAVKSGMNDSKIATASYTIKAVETPVFGLDSCTVDSGTSVTISCATEGAKIYYTIDGSEPTASSKEYTAAITVTTAVTIKAIAVKEGMSDSAVASVNYTIWDSTGFVKVPGGKVTGAAYKSSPGVFPEGRTVILSSFYMGKYEVTQAQYKAVMSGQKVTIKGTEYTLADSPSGCVQGSTSYKVDSDKDHANYPVECVNLYDAVYYCNELSKKDKLAPCYKIEVKRVDNGHILQATVEYDKTKNGYRLPTQAEWEYAARGGDPTKADWNYEYSGAAMIGSGGAANTGLDRVGWYCYNNKTGVTDTSNYNSASPEYKGTHEVGKKAPNALGIYDMSGNVREWCYDYTNPHNISDETVTDPFVVPYYSDDGVTCGGSWYVQADKATVHTHEIYTPLSILQSQCGFRVVRNAK